MLWLLAFTLASQAGIETPISPPESGPSFPDGMGHIGSYIPNGQLLSWCTSKAQLEVQYCSLFIKGVIDATGMIDVDFPKGPIDTSKTDPTRTELDVRLRVTAYLNALKSSRMIEPAARSVYDALVDVYPYDGAHKKEIPFRSSASTKSNH